MNANRHLQYIGHHLHNIRRFFGHPANTNDPFNRYTFRLKALHNAAGTKAGGFGKRTEYPWRITAQPQAADHAFQALVGIRCTATVKPIYRQLGVCAKRQRGCMFAQFGNNFSFNFIAQSFSCFRAYQAGVGQHILQRPGQQVTEPGIGIAKG